MKGLKLSKQILILLLVITPNLCHAQPDTVDFTLLPKADPFQSNRFIKVALEFDMKRFIRNKRLQVSLMFINNLITGTTPS